MEASSTVVIKVKYGDVLRRFSAGVVDEELDLSMDGLREKILSLFLFSPDTELVLTYVDEDGDVVTLVDEEDLRDVVKQALNPLRITVKLSAKKEGHHFHYSSGSSTPLRSPRVQRSSQNPNSGFSEVPKIVQEPSSRSPGTTEQKPLHNLNPGLSHIVRTVKEPLRDTIMKLSADLASKSSNSAPGVPELVEYFSKVGLSYLDQLSDFQLMVQPSSQGGVPESSTVAEETKDLGQPEVDVATSTDPANGMSEEQSIKSKERSTKPHPEATTENNELKCGNVKETLSLKALFGDMASAVDSKTTNVGKKEKLKKEKTKKEKVKNISESYSSEKPHMTTSNLSPVANNDLFAGNIGESCGQSLKIANASAPDPVSRDPLEGRTKYVSFGGLGSSLGSIWAPSTGSINFPSSTFGSSFTYDCPVTGVHVGNTSAAPPYHASQAFPHMRSNYQNDSSGIIFHRGVRCDGCGVHPITGPRFKSKVKVNYDLCSICFSRIGNAIDYFRMDRPAVHRPQKSLKGWYDANGAPTIPQVSRGFKVKSGASKLDSRFIQDVNIIDGTIMAPLTPFTKIWRMRNSGTVMWPQKTQLAWIGGDKLSRVSSVEVEILAAGTPVDQELDIAVDFIAPELPGRYISYWRMASPSGQKFGQRVWVLIQVDTSLEETRRESVRGLNLNLPPSSSGITGTEIIHMDIDPSVEDSLPEPNISKKMVENVEPAVDFLPNIEHEMKFPINDSLLVGNGASSSVPSGPSSVSYPGVVLSDIASSLSCTAYPIGGVPIPVPAPVSSSQPSVEEPSSVSYPGVVLSDIASSLSCTAYPIGGVPIPVPAPASSSQPSVEELTGNKEVEEELLKELEEMGFKQVDLNKEILRMNEYDLEQAVDDLCGVAEWDPILEELEEMGFHDTEMNKMLLKKNNGSIKRVVMDLIADGM